MGQVGDSLVSTLALVSRDSWAKIMRDGMDTTGPGTGPCFNANAGGAAYFLVAVFLGGIVGINILVATFIDRRALPIPLGRHSFFDSV